MGDLDYFVSVITFGEAARMVEYVEEADGWTSETPPRTQTSAQTESAAR